MQDSELLSAPLAVPMAASQVGNFFPLHASAFHEEDCVGCARLLLAAGARLDVTWVRHARIAFATPRPHPATARFRLGAQYSMTPLDYARYRNRTGVAGVIEAEATRLGLTNATSSAKPR